MLKIFAVALVAGAFFLGWYRNDLRKLTRDYACQGAFEGPLQHCIIRFPVDERGTDCMLGANGDGLYLSSSIEALAASRRWSFRYYAIGTPIFIPWKSLEIGDARFPMRGHLRFTVAPNKAIFFVPRETGRLLLASAGR